MLAAACLFLGLAWRERAATNRLRAELTQLREQAEQHQAPAATPAPEPSYTASALEMLSLSRSAWPSALVTLETAAVPGVTPTALDIVPADHSVRVEVEFSEYSALLKYLDTLNAGLEQPAWELRQALAPSGTAGEKPQLATATVIGKY
jgi:hypothetical protein